MTEETSWLGGTAPDWPGGRAQNCVRVSECAEPGAWVVKVEGALDMDSMDPFAQALMAAAHRMPRVVVDASGVIFADSMFLNLLLRVRPETHVVVAAPRPNLRRLLELTGVDRVLDVCETVSDALS
ncbi:STAS domain-containing protein [Streptomyces sp. WAC08401]|uniref:STAS domain-containing protein n=1 Tax=Streptomyces sp. WAC08401 TaxID=2487413 RepID=UPI000FBABA80|nr:STAS domain-containing protein [Streptomyces sp. WAC08401]RSS13984.1 anti-sigma factor antagonist [Streptomyces sp. WAC08401]